MTTKTPPDVPPADPADPAVALQRTAPVGLGPAAPLPQELVEDLQEHARGSRAERTFKAYASDWASWTRWCTQYAQRPLPATPEALAAYLSTLAKEGKALSTLRRHLATISRRHTHAGFTRETNPARAEAPKVVLDSVARKRGPEKRTKAPLTLDELEKILVTAPSDLVGLRARAMLLLGFHGAFRSSELAALNISDLTWTKEGVAVLVRRSKTDQEGAGFVKAIRRTDEPTCAVTAVQAWLAALRERIGAEAWEPNTMPLFCRADRYGRAHLRHFTGTVVSNAVKALVSAAGLDPRRFASHSLRAGYVTQSFDDGRTPYEISRMTGHKSETILRGYDRRRMKDPFAGVHTPRRKKP